MPKPVCVPCRRFYRPHRNGTAFVEGKPKCGSHLALPGLEAPDAWDKYKLWMGDLWRCQGCGHEIIVGCGFTPISEDFHPDFEEQIVSWNGDKIVINDC